MTRNALIALITTAAALSSSAPASADWRPDSPYAVHSMVYSTSPYGFKRAMFAEAAASGASSIRLDLVLGAVFAGGADEPAWDQVDEIVALSREFRIRVTAVVLDTPWWLADCAPDVAFERVGSCAPKSDETYADLVGRLAAHTRGTIDTFEILNEPDGRWAYSGTPEDYAHTLSRSYDAIKRASPRARVLVGGAMGTYSIPWLERVFATPGADAAHKFDIANVHVRGTLASVGRQVKTWRRFFARHGIDRPLWVTEHGYPSDPSYQSDPNHRAGEASQAEYLVASTHIMRRGGVDRIFVTLRDNLSEEFASEGLIGGTVLDPPVANPQIRRKAAFRTFRWLSALEANRPPSRSSGAVYRGARHMA
jgi:hypothetical protein